MGRRPPSERSDDGSMVDGNSLRRTREMATRNEGHFPENDPRIANYPALTLTEPTGFLGAAYEVVPHCLESVRRVNLLVLERRDTCRGFSRLRRPTRAS